MRSSQFDGRCGRRVLNVARHETCLRGGGNRDVFSRDHRSLDQGRRARDAYILQKREMRNPADVEKLIGVTSQPHNYDRQAKTRKATRLLRFLFPNRPPMTPAAELAALLVEPAPPFTTFFNAPVTSGDKNRMGGGSGDFEGNAAGQ